MASLFGKDVRIVGLVASNSPDYFNRFFDVISEGGIVVPLRTADDKTRIEACGISEVITPAAGSGWIQRTGKLPSGDRVAQIAFTSGTQGEPKGVILTQANIADTVERLCEVMQIDSSIREYVGVPVYHSFGLGRCRTVAAMGGKAYLPRDGFNPREIARMLEAAKINAISAVPTLWRTLLRNPEIIEPLGERVRWIEIGSQPMSKGEKIAMRSLFPNARIIQHYGLTEASRTTFLDISRSGLDELDSVGAPTGDIELDVTDSGLIRIRGSNVAAELLVGGKKIPNTDAAGWFATSDLGEIRNGNLYFLGRADDLINIGGLKVSADSLEVEIHKSLEIPNDLSVARIPDADRGESVLLAVKVDCAIEDDRILSSARAALEQQGIIAGASIRLMRVDTFPRTDSGKVKRNELADTFVSREGMSGRESNAGKDRWPGFLAFIRGTVSNLTGFGGKRGVREIYQEVFPSSQIGPDNSFVSLGGDSLKFIEMSMALESRLGRLPDDWETMSITELERISPERDLIKYVDTTVILRCIGIIGVVTIHAYSRYWGAANMLLVVAGYVFSKFQLRSVVNSGNAKPILLSAARVAAPAFCVLLGIQTLNWEFYPDQLFLFSNFTGNEAETWYVEAYVQIMLIFSLLFALPPVRAFARRDLPRFAFWGFVITLVLSWAGETLSAWPGAGLTHAPALSHHVPYMVIWLFLLGCVIEQTSDLAHKFGICLISCVAPFLVWGPSPGAYFVGTPHLWVWLGCLLLLFKDRIPLLPPLNWAAYLIGSASLFIYITHWAVGRAWHNVAPVESDVLAIFVALAAGIAFWIAWETITGRLLKLVRSRAPSRPHNLMEDSDE